MFDRFDLNRAKRPILSGFASALLLSCSGVTSEEQRQGEIEQAISEWAVVQRIWRDKEKEGQGCEGEILRGDELRDVVKGKRHTLAHFGIGPDPRRMPAETRAYKPDGSLSSSLVSNLYQAKYRIDGSMLCTLVLRPTTNVESCFRLIESPEGIVFEERLVAPGVSPDLARGKDLSCIELKIAEMGASE